MSHSPIFLSVLLLACGNSQPCQEGESSVSGTISTIVGAVLSSEELEDVKFSGLATRVGFHDLMSVSHKGSSFPVVKLNENRSDDFLRLIKLDVYNDDASAYVGLPRNGGWLRMDLERQSERWVVARTTELPAGFDGRSLAEEERLLDELENKPTDNRRSP